MKMFKKSIIILGFLLFMIHQPVQAATIADVETVLSETVYSEALMSYTDNSGNKIQYEMTYGEAILAAAMEKDIDPVELATHFKNTAGGSITGNPLSFIYDGAEYLASGGTVDTPPALTYTTYKTTTGVNYRTGAGTSYSKAGTLNKGTEIQVEDGFSQAANNYIWYRFTYNGGTYYIASDYLEKVETAPPAEEPVVPDIPVITYSTYKTTTGVNYRTGAGTSYSKAGTLNKGTEIQVEDGFSQAANGYTWYRFLYNGGTYYIASKYVTKVETAPSVGTQPGWNYINGVWYYLNEDGSKVTGWLLDKGTWYYMYPNGAMATGWIKLGKTWYYLKSSGAMATGWLLDKGIWYYMYTNGAMATGWIKLGKTWYYLQSSGAMVSDGTYEINGINYSFSSSGAWIE